MNEIYPRWVAAHGVMIITPVYWYQAPSVLKLMIDRLVCADGGNPDPTTTHGKNAEEAKALELQRMALSAASRRAHLLGRRPRRHRRRRDAAAIAHRLADRHEAAAGGAARRASIATSATTSRTRRATTRSTPTPRCRQEVRAAAKALVEAVALSRAGRFPHVEDDDLRPK